MQDQSTISRFPLQMPVREIAIAAQALVDLLDALGGDPDLEDATDAEDEAIQPHHLDRGPGCDIADPDGPSTAEWHTLGRFKGRPLTQSLPDEDAEQDDAPEEDDSDCCTAHEDRGSAYSNDDGLPGDADDAEQEPDSEIEQMGNDVPCLPVYRLEPNIFSGEREYLGMNNLQSSFVGDGAQVTAVD